jgi:L-ascorbate metabolism protein UlaG (beta-lactamase superfamily)
VADGLTLEWFGCTTFRVRVGVATLWFDTYLDKVPGVELVGPRAAEVTEADFAFISHTHFDHVHGADTIARNTGATVIGNYETARVMAACGVPPAQILATAGGDTVDCGGGVTVRALPSQHSCVWAGTSSADSGQACLGDLGLSLQQRRGKEDELFELLAGLSGEIGDYFAAADGRTSHRDGGQLAYLLEAPAGSLLVSASSGCWTGLLEDLRPDVAILACAGRPNQDGEPFQGSLADFLVLQAVLLGHPKVILCHHDALLPPVMPAVDVTEVEARLRGLLGEDRYLVLEPGAPVDPFV